jgi:8-oxo-dGTP diphosphatase
MDDVVRAAGGLVWRRGSDGGVEVVLVHRPKYDDWTFPKGKLEAGEDEQAAALREVEEETGLRCELGADVGSTSYVDPRGRRKTVLYFAMSPVGGTLEPAHEIDDARWVAAGEAARALSYERDGALLESLQALIDSERPGACETRRV